jgi:hypothetical protein
MVGTTGRGCITAAGGMLRVGLVLPVLRVVIVVGLAMHGSGIHAHADELPFQAHAQLGHPGTGVG